MRPGDLPDAAVEQAAAAGRVAEAVGGSRGHHEAHMGMCEQEPVHQG